MLDSPNVDPRTMSRYERRLEPLTADLTVADLAATAHFSPHHFLRMFRAVMGETVATYGDPMTRTEHDDPPWSILEQGTGSWTGEETMPPAPWCPGRARSRRPRQAVRGTIHPDIGGLRGMARRLLLPCLLLLGAAAARPVDVASQDTAGVFERLEGTWAGAGTLFGRPAAFTMRWDVADGLATLRFTNALVEADGTEVPVMSAVAVYRVDGDAEGVWLDSRGERVELAWTVADGALVVDWRAGTESGRTTYRSVDGGRVEVVDEVADDDGWRVFGTASHARVGAVPVASPPTGPLDAVAFMAGTWCSSPSSGGTMIEEHYTTPSANLVLGTTRYLRDGAAVGHEVTRIEADSAGVVLTPTPSGQAAVPFRMTESEPGRAAFENPGHDFPVRIEYERLGDELVARALGADGTGPEWRMSPCDPSR